MMGPVAFIAHELGSVGGIQTYVQQFLLAQAGSHDIRTLSRDRSPLALPHVRSASTSRAVSLLELGSRARLMRPHAVIADQIQTAAAARLASIGSRRRTATFVYGAELTGGRNRKVKRAALESMDRVWAITDWARRFLVDEFQLPPDSLSVLRPSVDLVRHTLPSVAQRQSDRELMTRRWGVEPGQQVILTVARLQPEARHKGVDLTVEAAAGLQEDGRRVTHLVVGDGADKARLEELARRKGAPAIFTGKVSDDELTILFRAADVFCMPSHNVPFGDGYRTEGFGIVYLQAAASGVPSVRGIAEGTAEAVLDGVTGSMADADALSVAEEIDHWLDRMAHDRHEVAAACRTWAQCFSRDSFDAVARSCLDGLTKGPKM